MTYLVFAYMGMLVPFAIFQPYKQKFFNCLDFLVIVLLVLITTLTQHLYAHLRIGIGFQIAAWIFTYTLVILPLLYMVGYVVYRSFFGSACCKKYCICKFKRTMPEDQSLSQSTGTRQRRREVSTSSEIPDRLENPHRYQDMSWSVADSEIDDPLQGDADADEHTSLIVRMNQVVNYGTNTEPTY